MTTITPQQALQRTIEHREIFYDEMLSLMRQIMAGEISPVMTAAILTGLRVKKETIGEITAAATVMREMFDQGRRRAAARPLPRRVGTGGDGANTFNISTTTIFVAAAAGARVAKHGGRGVSSKSGAADVIEALGVNLDLTPAAGRRVHRGHRHRLHVRPGPPQRDEERRAGAARDGRAHASSTSSAR